MTTFKQFLTEDISVVDGKLRISNQTYKAGSTKEAISTYFRSVPYKTTIKGTDVDVYSLLNYVSSEVSTDILKSLKGSGPYPVDDKQYQHFMSHVKATSAIFIRHVKPDIILYPKSSSPLLKQFVDEVAKGYPSAEVLSDAFIKSALNAEDVEPLINVDHPDWAKFAKENPKEVVALKRSLKKNLQNGELQLKHIYKPFAKFIKNFIELRDAYNVLEKVMDKDVLIIDDIYSTGSTMAEMVRQLKDFECHKIVGLTLFKLTTSPKD
jgi:hypoxanthine phosphoribosyltransferase